MLLLYSRPLLLLLPKLFMKDFLSELWNLSWCKREWLFSLKDRELLFHVIFPTNDPFVMPSSEMGILTSTALLHRIVRQVTSDVLLQEMVFFILGEQREPETLADISRHPLRHRLIEHCDHISDEVSYVRFRLGLWNVILMYSWCFECSFFLDVALQSKAWLTGWHEESFIQRCFSVSFIILVSDKHNDIKNVWTSFTKTQRAHSLQLGPKKSRRKKLYRV